MKKLLLLLLAAIAALNACKKTNLPHAASKISLPDTSVFDFWLQMADMNMASGRLAGFGFSIGSKGYIGGGTDLFNSLKDFWEYDAAGNTWTQKADLGGFSTESTASFVAGNKGYICTGYHRYLGAPNPANDSRNLTDTWQYDPVLNKWTKKASFPGWSRQGAVGTAIDGKGYIGTGLGVVNFSGQSVNVFFNDWYQYDPLNDTWQRKADFPGVGRWNGAAVAIGPFAYLGIGSNATGNYNADWWQYNAAANTWLQKASFPGIARAAAVALTASGKAFIVSGENKFLSFPANWLSDSWQYDPVANGWASRAGLHYGRSSSAGFTINNSIYVGTGYTAPHNNVQTGVATIDFWRYTP